MLDSQNFQSLFSRSIKDEVVLEILDTPRADAAQIFAFESTQPADERMFAERCDGTVNCLKEAECCFGIVLVDALEIAECIQLGIVTDKDFNAAHLRERPF